LFTPKPPELKIFPLGDSAVTIELGNHISEELNFTVLAMRQWLLANGFEGMTDVIMAYSSLTIYYDPLVVRKHTNPVQPAFEFVKSRLEKAFEMAEIKRDPPGDIIHIPVCYEEGFGTDLDFLASEKKLAKAEVIRLHTSSVYRVYMLGFLPGFTYMGEVAGPLITPRKHKPVQVTAGSVGIAGSQTGIYPLNSPGGWQIIGRTPIRLFDPFADIPVKLKTGDQVKFHAITKNEFEYGHW
jgi:inhibitor of KinA